MERYTNSASFPFLCLLYRFDTDKQLYRSMTGTMSANILVTQGRYAATSNGRRTCDLFVQGFDALQIAPLYIVQMKMSFMDS